VLIVDDNVDAAATLQASLELDGHSVRTAHDGHGALAAIAAERPDAVLLDIGLPDIDGLEVAHRLRAKYGDACPRLIALSGWGQEADKRRAAEAGFERHFTKPVDPSTLADMLAATPVPPSAAPARAA
jgi:CheY-like chemotaxis protein